MLNPNLSAAQVLWQAGMFGTLDLEFVSDFEIRISDLKGSAPEPTPQAT